MNVKNWLKTAKKQLPLIVVALLIPLFLVGLENKVFNTAHFNQASLPMRLALEQADASLQTEQAQEITADSQERLKYKYNHPQSTVSDQFDTSAQNQQSQEAADFQKSLLREKYNHPEAGN